MNWLGTFFSDWFGEWFVGAAGPPGSLSAGLSGGSTLSATLTAEGTPLPAPAGGGGLWPGLWRFFIRREVTPVSALLSGRGGLAGQLTATPITQTGFFSRALALLLAAEEE